jgi:hypothetical protein
LLVVPVAFSQKMFSLEEGSECDNALDQELLPCSISRLPEKPRIGFLPEPFLMGTRRGSTLVQFTTGEQWQYFDAERQIKTARRKNVYFHGLVKLAPIPIVIIFQDRSRY